MNNLKLQNGKLILRLLCGVLVSLASAGRGATINVLGSNPPSPGPNDQYQTNYVALAQSPPPGGGAFNYYVDANPSPGQTFTTGSNPNGYILSSLALYDADNTGGGFGNETFTLGVYSVSGATATLITTYVSQSIAIPDFNWFQWTGLGAILQPNTQYAYAMWKNGPGWMNLGNNNVGYSGGQVATVPQAGGTMNFSTSSPWNADFDAGLTAITVPVVGQPAFSPYSVTLPGTSVTASAPVTGPGPYSFQWQTDGGGGGTLTNIPGATASNLVINAAVVGHYLYDLIVSNNTSFSVGPVGTLAVQQSVGVPGVIAVKFGFTNYATTDAPFPADNTGVATGQLVPPSYQPLTAVGNWNNLQADVAAPVSDTTREAAIDQEWNIIQDTAGNALSGVTMTAGGFNDGWFSGGTGCAAGRLMYDAWKFNANNGQTDVGGFHYATLTFNNLSGSTYDVIVYINDNNGNYWGNAQANSVIAQNSPNVDNTSFGFNGASSDPCGLGTPFHTAGGFGNPVNYVKLPYVATAGGSITITVVNFGGGDMGVSGVELVPSPDLTLVQDTLPNYAETTVGEQVVFSAAFSNSPAVNLQWQHVAGGTTNSLVSGVLNATNNGIVTSTLTLNNVALTDAGTYQAKALNAGDSADYGFSAASQLVVSNTPAGSNNIVVYDDARAGANFYPPWFIQTNSDLIFGFPLSDGSAGTALPGLGNFGLDSSFGDPSILTDGTLGNSKTAMITAGPSGGAGQQMIYTLNTNSSPLGFELTNITVYGGWTDAGRRDQEYQVLYSTVSAPGLFIPLLTTHYLPADPSGSAIATRTKLVPASGVLAHNVSAVEINWNVTPQFLNGYAGYSEIEINGTNSTTLVATVPILIQDITPQTAVDVVGGQIVMSASFTNAIGVQWLKNNANITTGTVLTVTNNGIETSTLTLDNVQTSDSAVSSGYTAMATNAAGSISSGACAVTVNSASAPVNNAIVSMAAQTEDGTVIPVFTPTWDMSKLASSLLFNIAPNTSGNGDFTGAFDGNGDGASQPSVLTDGSFGQLDTRQTSAHSSLTLAGYSTQSGNFVSYVLPGSANGYNISNITVYAGWNDSGRDGQAYTIHYSTVANPTNFITVPLAVVNYLPTNPNGRYAMTRATITPASGFLASNVAALYFDFTTPLTPGGENGFEGYSEIAVYGSASGPLLVAPSVGGFSKSGNNLVVTGTGGYPPNSPYTWLSTTNLNPPVSWTTNQTGTLDGNGGFSNALPVNADQSGRMFFQLRIP
ncbi:MAG TPA: immunoglobulin domain-containing protein [Verrucomicrobiae bacterium]|jgi:hypothetical protein|nr:immunoglobulin domain-containing protein [Verrucomicrobiae bacterium]